MDDIIHVLRGVNTVVYGFSMAKRLSKSDWLDHGLAALAASGLNALKADPLAKSLKVSRGSFYWHFRDIDAFHSALLARWRARAADDIIADIEAVSSGGDRLKLLMRRALQSDNNLECAVRSWATQDSKAAKVVVSVDRRRLAYLVELLSDAGVPERNVRARAVVIYWSYLGRIMTSNRALRLNSEEIEAVSGLFVS